MPLPLGFSCAQLALTYLMQMQVKYPSIIDLTPVEIPRLDSYLAFGVISVLFYPDLLDRPSQNHA